MTSREMGTCPECGQKKMLWLIREDVTLCDECADELDWIQRDACGDFYPYDDVEFTELPDGRNICEYCAESLNIAR